MEWIDTKTVYTLLHLFGVAIGAGGAFMSDVMFLVSSKDKLLDRSEFRLLRTGSVVTWIGLVLLIVSGILLFSLDPVGYMASSKFITKMIIVLVLTINGFVFHFVHIPVLRKILGKKLSQSNLFAKTSRTMYISGAISVVSWVLAIVLGGLRNIPFSIEMALLLYAGLLFIAVLGAEIQRRRFLKK